MLRHRRVAVILLWSQLGICWGGSTWVSSASRASIAANHERIPTIKKHKPTLPQKPQRVPYTLKRDATVEIEPLRYCRKVLAGEKVRDALEELNYRTKKCHYIDFSKKAEPIEVRCPDNLKAERSWCTGWSKQPEGPQCLSKPAWWYRPGTVHNSNRTWSQDPLYRPMEYEHYKGYCLGTQIYYPPKKCPKSFRKVETIGYYNVCMKTESVKPYPKETCFYYNVETQERRIIPNPKRREDESTSSSSTAFPTSLTQQPSTTTAPPTTSTLPPSTTEAKTASSSSSSPPPSSPQSVASSPPASREDEGPRGGEEGGGGERPDIGQRTGREEEEEQSEAGQEDSDVEEYRSPSQSYGIGRTRDYINSNGNAAIQSENTFSFEELFNESDLDFAFLGSRRRMQSANETQEAPLPLSPFVPKPFSVPAPVLPKGLGFWAEAAAKGGKKATGFVKHCEVVSSCPPGYGMNVMRTECTKVIGTGLIPSANCTQGWRYRGDLEGCVKIFVKEPISGCPERHVMDPLTGLCTQRIAKREAARLTCPKGYLNRRNLDCVKLHVYEPEVLCDHCVGYALDVKKQKCVMRLEKGTTVYQLARRKKREKPAYWKPRGYNRYPYEWLDSVGTYPGMEDLYGAPVGGGLLDDHGMPVLSVEDVVENVQDSVDDIEGIPFSDAGIFSIDEI